MKDTLESPCLLIASPQLQDSVFEKAVILVIDHNEEGSFGFIINRTSGLDLNDVVSLNECVIPEGIPVWSAGPVMSQTGFVLHNQCNFSKDYQIAPGMMLSSDRSTLVTMVDHYTYPEDYELLRQGRPETLYPYRFFVGYSGWGPGQLEEEIKSGAWITTALDSELIFNVPEEKLWAEAMKHAGIDHVSKISTTSTQDWLN